MNILTILLVIIPIIATVALLFYYGVKLGASIYYQGTLGSAPSLPTGDTRIQKGEEEDESEEPPDVFNPHGLDG